MKRWMKNCLLCAVAAAAAALLAFTGLQSASLSATPDRGAMTGENPPALPSDGEEAVGEVTLPGGATSRAWLFPVGAAAAAVLGFCVAEAIFSRMNRVSPFPARREKHPTEKEGEAV